MLCRALGLPFFVLGAAGLRPTAEEVLPRQNLVFVHIPSRFGHTIEKTAMFPLTGTMQDMLSLLSSKGSSFEETKAPLTWTDVKKRARDDGAVWGRMNPELQLVSNVTGCNLYYTPQKYWPRSTAKRYFGSSTVFGLLRDPYERLVDIFRENRSGISGKFYDHCDVNNAVKGMMRRYMASDDKFMEGCAFVPQAEYFDGPYGISLPIDNRKFPASVDAMFKQHGYENTLIQKADILPVKGCENVWAGDLDAETKELVKKVYALDFHLLCKHFGYCNDMENTCVVDVEGMCPPLVKVQKQVQRFWGLGA